MIEASAAEPLTAPPVMPVRVLIADASAQDRASIRSLVRAAGGEIEIYETESASEALAILGRGVVDIAFVDIFLQGDTGINVMDAARRKGIKPFLVLTAGTVLPNWAMVATDAFAYEFLKKPYAAEDIINAVAACRRTRTVTNVLLADASVNGRNVVRKILQASRFANSVDETDNGGEALKMARNKAYDLALVDVGLVGMSGLEAACQLKSRNPDMAIALMLPQTDTLLASYLKYFGLDHALTKPFFGTDIDVLMHKIHGLRRPYLMNALLRAEKSALAG